MPEAVASNSMPMSNRQPRFGWKQHFSEQFEEIDNMLKAFNEMNAALYETKQDHSAVSYGIYLIHGLIIDRLNAASAEVDGVFTAEAQIAKGMLHLPLMERISAIVSAAFRDGERALPEDGRDWSEQDHEDYMGAVMLYYNELSAKAGGTDDLLEVGSLLPWLELKARRELACEEPSDMSDENSLRDRLIAQQAKEGVSACDLSQAFNLRRGAVERIIARLTAEEGEGRKAV